MIDEADLECRERLTPEIIHDIVALVPDDWLMTDSPFETTAEHRQAYEQFLLSRIEHSAIFVNEIKNARQEIV
jgi:hypothetical protein